MSAFNEKIKVSMGITINLGNFESARIDYGFERDLRHGENRDKAIQEESKAIQELVEEAADNLEKEWKK